MLADGQLLIYVAEVVSPSIRYLLKPLKKENNDNAKKVTSVPWLARPESWPMSAIPGINSIKLQM